MSLISIQNFMAPFRSKTHLVTLIIVAAVFGAFRLSGGSVTSTARLQRKAPSLTQSTDQAVRSPHAIAPVDMDSLYEPEPIKRTPPPRIAPQQGDSLLDSLSEPDAASQDHSKAKDDLNDIERKLGLR